MHPFRTEWWRARAPRWLAAVAGLIACGPAWAAHCLPDRAPNDQPAHGQPVSGEFCVSGAAGQHYYLWTIPEALRGRAWTIILESLAGENLILLVQKLDRDPRGGVFTATTLWKPPGGSAQTRVAVPTPLVLEPGLYGIVAAMDQPPGLFRLSVSLAKDGAAPMTAAAPGAPTAAAAPTTSASPAAPSALPPAAAPTLEKIITGADDDAVIPWTLDNTTATFRWTLDLRGVPGSNPRLRLHGPDNKDIQLDTGLLNGAGIVHYPDLGLPAAAYKLLVNAAKGASVTLRIYRGGARDSSHVDAPNSSLQSAFRFKPDAPLSGVLGQLGGARTKHYVALMLDDRWKNQSFDLVLRTPKDRRESIDLTYVTSDEHDANSHSGTSEIRLPHLSFAPGTYVFRISSTVDTDLPYTLDLENAAPLIAGHEHEPNDLPSLALAMPADGTISGASDGALDVDFFRLHVTGAPQLWQVDCDCKDADRLAIERASGEDLVATHESANGTMRLSSVLLGEGDHLLRLRSSKGQYVLHVKPQGPAPAEAGGHTAPLDAPLEPVDEIEPNDDSATAMPLALNSSRGGIHTQPDDRDDYRFTLLGPTHIRLTLDQSDTAARIAAVSWGAEQREVAHVTTPGTQQAPNYWDAMLSAGDYYISVKCAAVCAGPYRLRLESRNPFTTDANDPAPLPVTAQLHLDSTRVAAYSPDGQDVHGQLGLTSKSKTALDLTVTPYTADERWRASAAQTAIHLEPGASLSVPVNVTVPHDAWADHPVTVAFDLRDASDAHVSAQTEVVAASDTAPVAPLTLNAIPGKLAGGLNVAWSALGGTSQDNHPALIDGLFNSGGTQKLWLADTKAGVTIRLAGSAASTIAGFGFVPATSVPAPRRLRHFHISLSNDGTRFQTVLNGALAPRADAQYFVLPSPVQARFARLEPLDAQDTMSPDAALAELQVIADPATAPLGTAGLDISPILRGGHVVWVEPFLDSQAMLSEAATNSARGAFNPAQDKTLSWVVGFLDDRIARIESLAWSYPTSPPMSCPIKEAHVWSSLRGPRGPWTDLGSWQIALRGDSAAFIPKDHPAARFLRFTATPATSSYCIELPAHLTIREIAVSHSYHSVLALPMPDAVDGVARAGSVSSGARALALDTVVHGSATLGTHTDHWTLDVPGEGRGNLTLTLSNAPALTATLSMKDSSGRPIMQRSEQPSADVRRFSADVPPGRYDIEVAEPSRSLALSWDTSGSVSGWQPAIEAAVRSVVQDAVPGREEMDLFPFHDPVATALLKDFSGDPPTLFSALQAYDWHDQSSGAEGALLGASEALEARSGRRGIILLTDAETSSRDLTPKLWAALDKSHAQIFTLAVPTTSNGETAWKSRNLMTDWAVASGGFTQTVGDQGELNSAFKRAAAWMRAGAPYILSASLQKGPSAPGSLIVKHAAKETAKAPDRHAPATALLLDASGSMLQRIEGRQKIDIARSELDHLVREVIPAGAPTTLRVYGQGGSGSCRSDLMMSLAPLDRAKAEAIVKTLRSTNGARTATAASLHAVAQDLAGAAGAKQVVLITDGGENCGGNVEAEIAALHTSGVDLQLNVVGFDVDSRTTAATLAHWAQLGGGRYIESRDAASLDKALTEALREQFEVLDGDGHVVATGDVDGAAVTMPPGHYTARLARQADTAVQVSIESGGTANVVMPRGK